MSNFHFPHIPILVNEFLHQFKEKKITTFIDATLGAAGHSCALLEKHPEIELLIGIDQDTKALEIASKRLAPFANKTHLIHGNFQKIQSLITPFSPKKISGIFADLGVSSMQLDQAERGMSFSKEGPLDMRMDQTQKLTAREIVNTWPQRELEYIFREYGEEPKWKLVAHAVIQARNEKELTTTLDLTKALKTTLFFNPRKPIHPCTLVFQSLRIAVNQELKALEEFLPAAFDLLELGGILGVLSFHSLEDRIVKNYFREISGYKGGREHDYDPNKFQKANALLLTKKPICANEEEITYNPRSRSAKMRFIEKI
ncbi:MAG: 16S rRNA (cytosine(1402)-N(4))-methyltransferase RsmH [Chlamydiales bacterium]|nr:16S rRNA (cytosine(1402)-N(4))-methyltransferase RsmH [Chlamydiales bacterium]